MQNRAKQDAIIAGDKVTAKEIMTQAINDTKSMRIAMGSAVVNKLSKLDFGFADSEIFRKRTLSR